jgi:hypothetical protein
MRLSSHLISIWKSQVRIISYPELPYESISGQWSFQVGYLVATRIHDQNIRFDNPRQGVDIVIFRGKELEGPEESTQDNIQLSICKMISDAIP